VESAKRDRDEDWFPWDEESDESPPASATTGPWPGLGATPWRAAAGPSTGGTPEPAAASTREHAKDTDELEFRSYGAPSPAAVRGEQPLTAADQNAKDTDEIEVPAPGPVGGEGAVASADGCGDGEFVEAPVGGGGRDGEVSKTSGEIEDEVEAVDGGTGAGAGDAGTGEAVEVPDIPETGRAAPAMETVTDIPEALKGIPGPWDEAVAPAARIPTRVDELPVVSSSRDAASSPDAASSSETGPSSGAGPAAEAPPRADAPHLAPPGAPEASPDTARPTVAGAPVPQPASAPRATTDPAGASPPLSTAAAPTGPDRPRSIPPAPATVPGPEAPAASATPTVSDLPTAAHLPATGDTPTGAPSGHAPAGGHPATPGHTMALEVPGGPAGTHTFPAPYPGAGHRPPAYPPPAAGRSGGPSPKVTAALAAAGLAVLAAGGAVVFSQAGGSSKAPCAGAACGGTRRATSTAAAPAGPKLRYRTVDRETGYFEGTITIVNRGGLPMNAWRLTFTYPGADIHNVWEAVLMSRGETVTIANAATAAPIAPGGRFEVQFGGAGRPAMPTGCRLNDAPCVFVR
jgi:hypothetical protein